MPRDNAANYRKKCYLRELKQRGGGQRAAPLLQSRYRWPSDPPLDQAQTAHLVERWRACASSASANNSLRTETARVALLFALENYEIRALLDALREAGLS